MGMRWWRTNACERAMHWISLDADGELSQLEQAALARHVDVCERCRQVATDVNAFTQLLRDAPLVELERPVVVAAPRRARAHARRAAVSLAFAALAGVTALGGVVLTSGGTSAQSAFSFRNAQEQQRFAHVEATRLEPAVFVVAKPTVRSFAPRVLV